jgi:hypothetical protein
MSFITGHAIRVASALGLITACFVACSSGPSEPSGTSSSAIVVQPIRPIPIQPINPIPTGLCNGGEADEPAVPSTCFPDCVPNGCNCDQVPLSDVNGTCIPCGANGEIACIPLPQSGYAGGCNEGSQESAGGTCGPCGANGEPACQTCGQPNGPTCPLNNDGCNSGTVNVNQQCECGALNQIACVTGNKCEACASGSCALGTNADGTGIATVSESGVEECVECGGIGQPACTTGTACGFYSVASQGYCGCPSSTVDLKGTCVACGAVGEAACSNGCDYGANPVDGYCRQCGRLGEPWCGSNSVCITGDSTPAANGTCECETGTIQIGDACSSCGTAGLACCVGADPCHTGLTCNAKKTCVATGSGSSGGSGGTCVVEQQDYYEDCNGGFQQLPPVYYCEGSKPTPPAGDDGCVVYPGDEPQLQVRR